VAHDILAPPAGVAVAVASSVTMRGWPRRRYSGHASAKARPGMPTSSYDG